MPARNNPGWEGNSEPTISSQLIDYLHRCGGEGSAPALIDYLEMLGYAKRSIRQAIDGLIDDGYLDVLEQGGGRGHPTVYGYNYQHPLDGNILEDQIVFNDNDHSHQADRNDDYDDYDPDLDQYDPG
jgi:hypothetical protein